MLVRCRIYTCPPPVHVSHPVATVCPLRHQVNWPIHPCPASSGLCCTSTSHRLGLKPTPLLLSPLPTAQTRIGSDSSWARALADAAPTPPDVHLFLLSDVIRQSPTSETAEISGNAGLCWFIAVNRFPAESERMRIESRIDINTEGQNAISLA